MILRGLNAVIIRMKVRQKINKKFLINVRLDFIISLVSTVKIVYYVYKEIIRLEVHKQMHSYYN